MRRLFQKPSVALPRSTISGIKHPKSALCQKFHERLLPRYRGHPVTKNNDPLLLAGLGRWQKLSDNLFLESGPECHWLILRHQFFPGAGFIDRSWTSTARRQPREV